MIPAVFDNIPGLFEFYLPIFPFLFHFSNFFIFIYSNYSQDSGPDGLENRSPSLDIHCFHFPLPCLTNFHDQFCFYSHQAIKNPGLYIFPPFPFLPVAGAASIPVAVTRVRCPLPSPSQFPLPLPVSISNFHHQFPCPFQLPLLFPLPVAISISVSVPVPVSIILHIIFPLCVSSTTT